MTAARRVNDVKSSEELDQAVANNTAVVVHFWAAWCEPCGQMDRVLESLAANYASETAQFMRVEAEEVDDLAERYNVVAVPYCIVFKGGEVVATVEGADVPALTNAVDAHLDKAARVTDNAVIRTDLPSSGGVPSNATGNGISLHMIARLRKLITSSHVMLFMKGSPEAPRCGFSSQVVSALRGASIQFGHFDILGDPDVRSALKEYSEWPTYPQLYAGGDLVGGADIVLEMAQEGQLRKAIDEALAESSSETVQGPSGSAPASAAAGGGGGGTLPTIETTEANPGSGALSDKLQQRLRDLTMQSRVMLFMKGSREQPFCRFSKAAIAALKETGAPFGTFDIFQDDEVREGLKKFSDWPTYPQLFVEGELVGGADIIAEMAASKELAEVVCPGGTLD